MSIIFNKSLISEQVPSDWKKARISAIHKKGNKKLVSNYRPVSLTAVVCKIMETIVRNHIVEHMKKNKLFSNKQYGFISGRSTSLQLLAVLDKWTEALDCGYSIDVIYMDFQKAFDTVPHRRLIGKLKTYGISTVLQNWITSFLSDRLQKVTVNGSDSAWFPVTSGIPQGSVLGPILFVIFINDLPDLVESDAFLFADDTKVYKIVTCLSDRKYLQRDLDRLDDWSKQWLILYNTSKCKHMHIGREIPDSSDMAYKLNGQELETVTEEKDIGVFIDNRLNFDKHISEKVKKANCMFGIIRRNFQFLDNEMFNLLYKTYVRPHLDYASSAWAPYKIRHIEQIEKNPTKGHQTATRYEGDAISRTPPNT